MQFLPRILYADVTEPRHVRNLPRDAPPRTLEEKTNVHPYIPIRATRGTFAATETPVFNGSARSPRYIQNCPG